MKKLCEKIFKIRFTIGKIASLIFAFIGCFSFGCLTTAIIEYGLDCTLMISALCSILIMVFAIMLYSSFKTYEEVEQ